MALKFKTPQQTLAILEHVKDIPQYLTGNGKYEKGYSNTSIYELGRARQCPVAQFLKEHTGRSVIVFDHEIIFSRPEEVVKTSNKVKLAVRQLDIEAAEQY